MRYQSPQAEQELESGLGHLGSSSGFGKMSRPEQVALLAFFNSFKLSKAITAVDQLSDGKLLMEVRRHLRPLSRSYIFLQLMSAM